MTAGNDPLDGLLIGIDHLRVASELLESGEPAKERMALILLDGYADALLFRRVAALFGAVEQGWWYREQMPTYSAKTRKNVKQDFDTRLRIASAQTYLDGWTSREGPFISDGDRTVLRIAHTYRNAAYHRDSHNPATVGVFGRLMILAVSNVFVSAQGHGWSYGGSDHHREQLKLRGIDWAESLIDPHVIAATVKDQMFELHAQTKNEVAAAFADDLEWRFSQLDESLEFLRSDGRMGVDESIAWFEFYDRWGSDDDILLALGDEMDPYSRAKREGLPDVPEEFVEDAKVAPGRYFARRNELMLEHPPTVSSATLEEARHAKERLGSIQVMEKLLERYHHIDREISKLEMYVNEAAAALDAAIQHEIDVARGK